MAKKAHQEIVQAFFEGRKRRISNFATDGNQLLVHGNLVAEKRPEGVAIRDAGWQTQLTKNVLNEVMHEAFNQGLEGGAIVQEKGVWWVAPIGSGEVPDWDRAVEWPGEAILKPRR